eukprot:scaffold203881_cov15-Tisochrysis_lutea.AAC.1
MATMMKVCVLLLLRGDRASRQTVDVQAAFKLVPLHCFVQAERSWRIPGNVALLSTTNGTQVGSSNLSRCAQHHPQGVCCASPSLRSTRRASRAMVLTRAEGGQGGAATEQENKGIQIDINKIPPLVWEEDKETLRDLMAFSGPAPEVRAGRHWLLVQCKMVPLMGACSRHVCVRVRA